MREIYRHPPWFKPTIIPWLERGEIPADPLTDLRTRENSMSVWLVDDEKNNLGRLVAALGASRHLQEFKYLLFDQTLIKPLLIQIDDKNPGKTPDEEVNHFHRDLLNLSGQQALDLVSVILNSDYETGTMTQHDVKEYVIKSVVDSYIDYRQLHKSFQKFIEP